MIIDVSTVSEKGQVVIPREVHQVLDVKRGDRLSWSINENGELKVVLVKTDLMTLKGGSPSRGKSVSIEDMKQAVRDGATESA